MSSVNPQFEGLTGKMCAGGPGVAADRVWRRVAYRRAHSTDCRGDHAHPGRIDGCGRARSYPRVRTGAVVDVHH
jgi:hypothetical protein